MYLIRYTTAKATRRSDLCGRVIALTICAARLERMPIEMPDPERVLGRRGAVNIEHCTGAVLLWTSVDATRGSVVVLSRGPASGS